MLLPLINEDDDKIRALTRRRAKIFPEEREALDALFCWLARNNSLAEIPDDMDLILPWYSPFNRLRPEAQELGLRTVLLARLGDDRLPLPFDPIWANARRSMPEEHEAGLRTLVKVLRARWTFSAFFLREKGSAVGTVMIFGVFFWCIFSLFPVASLAPNEKVYLLLVALTSADLILSSSSIKMSSEPFAQDSISREVVRSCTASVTDELLFVCG
mmetsp:Transcript_40652/g.66745  ORF Transcript_40652/g.66745 Transcript_40652/m.66745 type:complete len:215 (-) Transcript_40652:93-737(-)